MQKPASQLKAGDQLLTKEGFVTVLNVGEDKVKNEQVVFWNNWNNKAIRIPLSQQIQTK